MGQVKRPALFSVSSLFDEKGGDPIDSFITRVGGKKLLRSEIVSRFPAKYNAYVEVFGGAGWVLFHKPRPKKNQLEVYNDIDGNLVNLFYMAKERPFGLLKELNYLNLNSREDFFRLRQLLQKQDFTKHYLQSELEIAKETLTAKEFMEVKQLLMKDAADQELRRAAAMFKMIRYSYGGGTTSFGCQPCNIAGFGWQMWRTHHRLRDTVIENQSYQDLIPHYDRPDSFFYCDPPYVAAEGFYESPFIRDDHEQLADMLRHMKGKYLLSYNDHKLVRDLYADQCMIELTRLDSLAQVHNPGQMYKELLIANYDLHDTAAEAQLSLF